MRKSLVALLALIALSLPLAAQVPEFAGPPAFLTFPILLHVNDRALDHGHFVFGGKRPFPPRWRRTAARPPSRPLP